MLELHALREGVAPHPVGSRQRGRDCIDVPLDGALRWLLTREPAVHTDDTLAWLRDDRVRCGPRSLFHGMRLVAARWGGHVAASRLTMGCG